MTPSLTTRIQTRIAQDRAMLAAGTQGKWLLSMNQPIAVYENDVTGRAIALQGEPQLPPRPNGETLANMTLIAACVNDKEGHLLVIEGLLGAYRARAMGWKWAEAILTRWIEGRERDGKA